MARVSRDVKLGIGAMRPLTLRHFIEWLIESLQRNPLAQLRRMRDLERRVRSLVAGRDAQILAAIELGYSQRQIAKAAGLSQPRVHKIKSQGGES